MRALFDFDTAPVFAIPVIRGFGGPAVHEGVLIEGPQGWGEFSPPSDADERADVRALTAALEPGTVGWPDAVRGRIPVSVTVPVIDPGAAHDYVTDSSCRTADVIVAAGSLADDIARVEAVRDALGPHGAIRCDARGRWDVDDAVKSIAALAKAAGGLEFVVQPCATVEELTSVRRRVDVAIAAEARRIDDPRSLTSATDVVVLHTAPLGGVRRALRVAEQTELPCVVASALETSVGLSSGLALAGVLPELPFACGFETRRWLATDVTGVWRTLSPVDGFLPVAPMPPAPDLGHPATYALRDPDRVAWWRDRLRTAAAAT